MKPLVELLEREGGHIIALFLLTVLGLFIASTTTNETTRGLAMHIADGTFGACLALLKGNSQPPAPSAPKNEGIPDTTNR